MRKPGKTSIEGAQRIREGTTPGGRKYFAQRDVKGKGKEKTTDMYAPSNGPTRMMKKITPGDNGERNTKLKFNGADDEHGDYLKRRPTKAVKCTKCGK